MTAKTYESGIPKIQKQTDNIINGAHTSPVPLNAPSETAIKVSKINRNPTKNIISWDLSVQGARDLNTLCTANSDIYYFSFVNSNTVLDNRTGRHVPHRSMSFIIRSNARIMGMKKAYYADGSSTDSSWFENDGIVNKVSMYGPTSGLNGPAPITKFNENELLIPGQWYVMDEIQIDHKKMVGHWTNKDNYSFLVQTYINHIELLKSLP